MQVCDVTIALDVDEDEGDEEALSSDPDRPHDMGVEKTDQVSYHNFTNIKNCGLKAGPYPTKL